MRILVATAGALPPAPVADLCEKLLGGGGNVTVLSVIEVPRAFLDAMDAEDWTPFDPDTDKEAQTERAVAEYVEERGSRLVQPVVAALVGRGIDVSGAYIEGADPAEAIAAYADANGVDLVMLGATRAIFSDGSWGSVSGAVAEHAHWPVLLIPGAGREPEAEELEPERAEAHQS